MKFVYVDFEGKLFAYIPAMHWPNCLLSLVFVVFLVAAATAAAFVVMLLLAWNYPKMFVYNKNQYFCSFCAFHPCIIMQRFL